MQITENDIQSAVKQLCRSERGRAAAIDLYELLSNGADALDSTNRQALVLLVNAAFGDFPGTVKDALGAIED